MFGQSLLSAFGIACTTDTDQLFGTDVTATSTATYQLNNVTTSIPSNTYPGTANNITYTSGKFGNAAVFNGSNADIDISSSAINTTSPYTISMWLNIVDVTQYEGIFANVTSSYLTNQIAFVLNNGKISIYSVVSNGNTTLDAITATPQSGIANNTWFNLVIVADRSLANKAKVFFNGVEASYAFVSGGAGTSAYSNIKVGLADGANRYFTGSIDQIRFFNSSLPQSAVTALYNETTTTATSASIDYVDANPNSIAYYKMSNAIDQLGNYNGTASNVNFNTEGKFGFAGAFNGSSSIINLGDHNVFSPSVNPLSFSLWIKKSTSDFNCIYSKGASGSYEYALFISGSGVIELVAYTLNASSSVSISTSASYSDGNWHHVVAIYDPSGSFKIYVDGSQQATSSTSLSMGNSSNALNIGKKFENNVDILNGSLDQVRIFNSAITAENVTALYEEVECPIPSDTLGVCNYPIPATSLYQLQGPTILDNCGNYPGTIVGGATFTSGKFGNALDLTTSSTYAQLQTLPSSWSANPCSLSVWVNMRTLTSGWSDGSYIFSAKADWRLQFTSNSSSGITFGKWNSTYGNNGNNELKSAVPSLNTWYHVVVTDNQANDATGNLKLYINGVLEDSQIGYASPRTFSGYASIGASGEGRNGINGQIDQLRLFPYILTQADVTKLYNE